MGIWDTVFNKGYDLLIKEEEKKECEARERAAHEKMMQNELYNSYADDCLNDYEAEHLKTIRKYIAECTVLLKSNGDFPLDGPCKIAAYGHGVRNTVKGGTGSGEVNSRFFVNVEQGLEMAGFEITTGRWLDAYDEVLKVSHDRFIKYIKEKAKQEKVNMIAAGMGAVMPEPNYRKYRVKNSDADNAPHKAKKKKDNWVPPLTVTYEGDAAIYVVSRISGEGNDRRLIKGDYRLNESEIKDILLCNKKYKKFMLIINAGGPVDLSPVMEVPNILALSQLGVETGRALADILLGKMVPSGKLATTWLKSAQTSLFPFGEKDDTVYEEGVYVGYRYFDRFMEGENYHKNKEPLFPFGHGLSYTTFSISNVAIQEKVDNPEITISCTVKNTGKFLGKEVVQVYVSAPNDETSMLDKPYQVLATFAKTKMLVPGEQTQITASFKLQDIASFDEEKGSYVLESGDYVIRVGNSSRNTVVAGKRHLRNTAYFPINKKEGIDEIAVNPYVAAMSDEELAYMCIGAFDAKGGISSVIGMASNHVAGAAGESCGLYEKKGLRPLVMADGPAGLRLSKEYFVDEQGKAVGIGSVIPAFVSDFLPKPVVKMVDSIGKKPKADREILKQYTTALPIATAIAQSWNLHFAEKCGDVVGDEMKHFNIDLWLAPALNIHRNVLCGRNFEYFSEDPLISGMFAAAMTQGVQKHAGCGVTVKHFLANNQEYNRYCSNSVISERALREIYMRGFEICVKEAEPVALMTSYNLVNGEHTSESSRFITDILRGEWGYKGVVMTDWIAGGGLLNAPDSKYGAPKAWKVTAAGTEMFMPGSKKDYDNLLKAMKKGEISRRQVEINASRLWKLSNKLKGTL
ncbi:MAG: glycoside hydrolase family 3 C-terminal domain-containing protein [Lachnospiraceae bacterium]|nr:glycoside hydrolase family 3 C-terminal domain-containing protein [Lachnospiraceae bacterium]